MAPFYTYSATELHVQEQQKLKIAMNWLCPRCQVFKKSSQLRGQSGKKWSQESRLPCISS